LARGPVAAATEACLPMSCNIHMNELPLIDATHPAATRWGREKHGDTKDSCPCCKTQYNINWH